MGETLAGLHRLLARITPRGIPEVAALRAVRSDVNEEFQLLHGDFNSGNLRRTGPMVRVFDFDDCGYGPRSFEIANALYMVLFDATIEADIERYRTFENAFLNGYETETATPSTVDSLSTSSICVFVPSNAGSMTCRRRRSGFAQQHHNGTRRCDPSSAVTSTDDRDAARPQRTRDITRHAERRLLRRVQGIPNGESGAPRSRRLVALWQRDLGMRALGQSGRRESECPNASRPSMSA